MGLTPSHDGPQGHGILQLRRASWLVLACAAFWAGLVLTALAVMVHP